jgi:hypothetical protein
VREIRLLLALGPPLELPEAYSGQVAVRLAGVGARTRVRQLLLGLELELLRPLRLLVGRSRVRTRLNSVISRNRLIRLNI